MFGMRVPQSSNCEWVILFSNLLNIAHLLGLRSNGCQQDFSASFRFFRRGSCSQDIIDITLMPGLQIHQWWPTMLQKWSTSIYIILYSSGTGGTGKPIHFMDYRGVCKSGRDLYRLCRQVFETMHVCPDNRKTCNLGSPE